MKKFFFYLFNANKNLKSAKHLLYITYPILRDKKVLLSILEKTNNAVIHLINSIIYKEKKLKKIKIHKDPNQNLLTFTSKSYKNFMNKSELNKLINIIEISKFRKKSIIEFYRGEDLILLTENMKKRKLSVLEIEDSILQIQKILKRLIPQNET